MKPSRSRRTMLCLMCGIAASVACLERDLHADEPGSPASHVVWQAGRDNYHTYRIPAALVTPQGTVLAFSEGRKLKNSDAGKIDLVLKRSTNGGRDWSPQQIVWTDGDNTCGNPCPVVDHETGTIWLLLTHNLGEDSEREIIAGKSRGTRTVWVTSSTDDGVTWAQPREITATTKKPGWAWYATGPGVGIQLRAGPHKGRLVIPCDHIEAMHGGAYSHVIYSDDHGASWKHGGRVPPGMTNECQVAELAAGKLLLNMRNHGTLNRTRAISTSQDGGITWSEVTHDAALVEPVCQASLVAYVPPGEMPGGAKESWLLFSNPADQQQRVRMTVRLSKDRGKTWSASRVLNEGPSAYSSLTILPDGKIGCLYESESYKKIVFAVFDLGWLAGSPQP